MALPLETESDRERVKLREGLPALKAAIDGAAAGGAKAASQSRFIRTRTNFSQ